MLSRIEDAGLCRVPQLHRYARTRARITGEPENPGDVPPDVEIGWSALPALSR